MTKIGMSIRQWYVVLAERIYSVSGGGRGYFYLYFCLYLYLYFYFCLYFYRGEGRCSPPLPLAFPRAVAGYGMGGGDTIYSG